MLKTIACFSFALPFALAAPDRPGYRPLSATFAQVGITAEQGAAIDAGRPVAKVLQWGTPSEVYVFGAVHIAGSPAVYLKMSRDVTRLAGTPGYLAIGELPQSATSANLGGLSLE